MGQGIDLLLLGILKDSFWYLTRYGVMVYNRDAVVASDDVLGVQARELPSHHGSSSPLPLQPNLKHQLVQALRRQLGGRPHAAHC